MSVNLRLIIERSQLGLGFAPKCVLLHLADAAQDPDLVVWRSKRGMAAQLETDFKTIARNLKKCERAGFISLRGEHLVKGGAVDEYTFEVSEILRTPALRAHDERPELANKIAAKPRKGGSGREPAPQWSRASGAMAQNHPNGDVLSRTDKFAKKNARFVSAHDARVDDHLGNNPSFDEFLLEQRAMSRRQC